LRVRRATGYNSGKPEGARTLALSVGYLGPEGTFTEEAGTGLAGPGAVLIPFTTIPDVARAVLEGRISLGVVPVENSQEGAVNVTLDFLAHEPGVPLVIGELVLRIRQVLAGPAEGEPGLIEVVYSHPQGLAQCRRYLERNYPSARQVTTASTAEAARSVSSGTLAEHPRAAAIASSRAADRYGLQVWATDIQDNAANETRFWALGTTVPAPTGQDKTSLVFSVPHRPGTLYAALGILARARLNLTRIESRPSRRRLGEYVFFIDFEGHAADAAPAAALKELRAQAEWLRILGSYRMASR
jgi:prephenate dehydratase